MSSWCKLWGQNWNLGLCDCRVCVPNQASMLCFFSHVGFLWTVGSRSWNSLQISIWAALEGRIRTSGEKLPGGKFQLLIRKSNGSAAWKMAQLPWEVVSASPLGVFKQWPENYLAENYFSREHPTVGKKWPWKFLLSQLSQSCMIPSQP